MDNHSNASEFTILSFFAGMSSWVTLHNAQYLLSFIASFVAIASGIMAVRYYYYATKKINKNAK